MSDTSQDRRYAGPPGSFVERRTAVPDTELMSPATQIVGDKDLYLGNAPSDIGRRIADDQLELFVVCHPAEAMLQQFSQLAPDFITIHDIGTTSSPRLLAAVATASSRKLQKLVIRRQGYGVALATLQFVELPLTPGRMLRVYTTQIDADTQTRHQLGQVLLAHSRLGVVLVGELPPHALGSSLQPLRDAIATGPWPNRQMLLVPLAAAATLPSHAAAMVGHSGVMASTTPQVGKPADAWAFISGAWNRLNSNAADAHAPKGPPMAPTPAAAANAARAELEAFAPPPTAPAYAPTLPMALGPDAGRPVARPVAGGTTAPAWGGLNLMPGSNQATPPTQAERGSALWGEYVQRCAVIKGVAQCCVFDIDQQRSLAHSGTQRMADRLAAKGAMLHAVMVDTANALGLGQAEPDAAITLAQHFLLIRPMPGKPRIALHLVLDRDHGNIGLARAQLHQIDQALFGSIAA